MTGDDTENDPGHPADDAAPAPTTDAGAAAVGLTAEEQAVPDFDVPEPPSFGGASADLPVPDEVAAEPMIPPPPVFDDAVGTGAPDTPRPVSRAAQRAQNEQPTAPAVSYIDVPSQEMPGSADGNSYRGWTVAIYAGLTVLFLGAVGLMVFLGLGG
ncbi:hypothetical protein HD600_001049 [Microbacterium ginsengiterrae]|uniref:Uncharacterized protein n=1 Tax=Microbacterium ginsengiterrae TaxID=546115 RepID=A0A7W9CBH9_9MICO|nr:hypothetical protein [Microbacterium ginsengiterrae]MBB5742552.1 hypothetical protein [Microbacterium ginsengiterrae]